MANFGMNAGLHLGPPTPTRAKSGHRDWIPFGAATNGNLNSAGLHLGPPTPTGAKSGHEDWIPLSTIPPPWLPIRTYARGCEAEWLESSLPPVHDATTGDFLKSD